jgi:hypothetical protein
MRLRDRDAAALDGCAFLTGNQICINEQLEFGSSRRNKYLSIGWPVNRLNYDKRRRVTNPTNLALTGALAARADYARNSCNPRVQLLIEFRKSELRGPNRKHGETPPKFKGLSGGGIFTMPSLQQVGDPSPPQLVGLSVEWSKSKGLYFGTRIGVVLVAIDKSFGGNS